MEKIEADTALAGAAEAAEILGIPGSSVSRMLKQGRLPTPLAILNATPVWRWDELEQFAERRRREARRTEAHRQLARTRSALTDLTRALANGIKRLDEEIADLRALESNVAD
jgi:hypothetical protein